MTRLLPSIAAALTLGSALAPQASAQCDLRSKATLFASDAESGDSYGHVVVANDDWIMATAPYEGGKGAVYAYERGNILQESKILSVHPDASRFGTSASLDGAVLAVGDPGYDGSRGRVELFQFDGATWVFMTAVAGAEDGDSFGYDVSLDLAAGWLAVGAPGNDGSTWIFQTDGSSLSLEKKLTPGWDTGNLYGFSVSLDGDLVVVGEPLYGSGQGRLRMYEWTGVLWTARDSMVHSDSMSGDLVGWDVSLDDECVLAGAPYHGATATNAGAAFLFERSGLNTWDEAGTLLASYGEADDSLGYTVQLCGTRASAGSPFADSPNSNMGSVTQWTLRDGTWIEAQRLVDTLWTNDAYQGVSVYMHGDETFVGATGRNDPFGASQTGGVAIFDFPEIALQVDPASAYPNVNMQVKHAGGDPSSLVMLFVTGVDGSPFLLKLARSNFNAEGAWNLQGSYPTSLGGLDIDLQSFSISGDTLETSNVFPLTLN